MKYLYLLVDFFTIIIPFIFSFHPKLKFHKTWKAFFPAVFITGLYFILWDMYYTHLGVWGFNEQYLTGINIFNLPIEEILFFFCIPYSCVFTFHCLLLPMEKKWPHRKKDILTPIFIIVFIIIGIIYYPNLYTSVTFFSLAVVLAIAHYFLKVTWLINFYIVYAVLLIPFTIVNGVLTGTGLENPIVWYNENEIIGLRILTIPVEDVFYGMELILINLLIYKFLLKKYNIVAIPSKNK